MKRPCYVIIYAFTTIYVEPDYWMDALLRDSVITVFGRAVTFDTLPAPMGSNDGYGFLIEIIWLLILCLLGHTVIR